MPSLTEVVWRLTICLWLQIASSPNLSHGFLNQMLPASRHSPHVEQEPSPLKELSSSLEYSCQSPHSYHTGYSEKTNKSKVQILGEILKRHVLSLRRTPNKKVDLVFLVDSSASVGKENFFNELKFVKKLLADFTVDQDTTRVSVITFSSPSRVVRHIDHMTRPRDTQHKCSLLQEELPKIKYTGGGTFTLGAVLEAKVMVYENQCMVMESC